MRRVIFSSAVLGLVSFYAGKYIKDEEIRIALEAEELAKANRNNHNAGAIIPPFRLLEYPHYNILYSTVNTFPLSTTRVPLLSMNTSSRISSKAKPLDPNFSSQMKRSRKSISKSINPTTLKHRPIKDST